MEKSRSFNYLFRRHPLFRALFLCLFIVTGLLIFFLIHIQNKAIPEIESITPPVGSPGDVITITGKNFGAVRDVSYVEIAGSKLTASSYIEWSDSKITIVLPANIQDGLVYVCSKNQKSKPSLFANEVDIPVPVVTVRQTSRPVITGLSADTFRVGDKISIYGNNFGDDPANSKLMFTIDYNKKIANAEFKNINVLTEDMLTVNPEFFGFVSWTNTEIQLYAPDGIDSGVIVIDNGTEKSDPYYYNLKKQVGEKTFTNKKIYIVQYSADIDDIEAGALATITLRCPIPASTPSQPDVQITETNPQPTILNYNKDIIYQISSERNGPGKYVFSQTFVMPVYEMRTSVDSSAITSFIYKYTNPAVKSAAMNSDGLIPSDDEKIKKMTASIIGRETNPYLKARQIYNYMCRNFKIQNKTRKMDADPLDLLETESGDAYDFALVYTAALRAAGIPAFMDSGILVTQDLKTQEHWWSEFYVESFGWIPVDVALGAGLEYPKWNENDEVYDKDFYFGNLDSHHILFSRGWNGIKPFSLDNKIVQRPRSFALQSIWEESNGSVKKYSSYWTQPVIKGMY